MRKSSRSIHVRVMLATVLTTLILLLNSALLRANATDARFVVVANGIQDQVTKLLWQQPDDGNVYTWSNAQAHCASPWRLPTLAELYTLVDVRDAPGPLIDSNFTNSNGGYWTSTPLASTGTPTLAWIIAFNDGRSLSQNVTSTYRVKCVQ